MGLPLWVGPSYRPSGLSGVHLLVLADKEPEQSGDVARVGRGLDCSLTQKYIDGTMPHREFTDVARLVLGRPASRSDCENFWRSVAFTNPAPPSGGSRKRPQMSDEDWELTRQAFLAVFEETTPDALLVFGPHLLGELRRDSVLVSRLDALVDRTAVVLHPGVTGFSFREHQVEVRRLGLA
jgi:hypothetical protein